MQYAIYIRIYAGISIQVTGDYAEHQEKLEWSYQKFPMLREKLHFGRVLPVLIFVSMIVVVHDRWW